MKVYVASSWRNIQQPEVVAVLRRVGHEVYDFKNPGPGDKGFGWSAIDPNWRDWTPDEFICALDHPIARRGFENDMRALVECEACVLVLPCGRSAHLELGYAVGALKRSIVLMPNPNEPELMYRMCDRVCTSLAEVVEVLSKPGAPSSR
jgi:hypothetical protein